MTTPVPSPSGPTAERPLRLGGAFSSPYSIKMRAVLRYRRIPFVWVPRDSKWDDLPPVPVRIIPAIAFPDEDGAYREAAVDSSPLILRLEELVPTRRVVPADPALAFLDALIEDYGDEWVTKAMYHYRWYYPECIAKAGHLLPLELDLQMEDRTWGRSNEYVTDRQISRRALVGSTEENRPVIEGSYGRLLDLMERHLAEESFWLGQRPGCGDFGIFGQLSQLVLWDPVPAKLAVDRAPRVVPWCLRTDDASWWPVVDDEGWNDRDSLAPTVGELLAEIGSTYVPFLVANAAALEEGRNEVVSASPDGPYRQAPFRYQAKCLGWLRDRFSALGPSDRQWVKATLASTGCEPLLP